ncbi:MULTISPECIES: hypothetical protein [Pantoea]|nr:MULTISPECIES: hypothetical protein [Pantoea]KAA5944822.1 hypothetical protein F3I57_12445 [Pantoea sp. VH_3]KAA5951989.1 hypothetical protein F3I56_12925 [Pantoea sp. VH_25]KAA5963554.1 hypothetical protein F3I54_15450 [Pantoea sp. VH_18]KAA5977238.1 hypothetical protein F3I49_23655 [Pantoea sp. M_4]KAA5997428.1 hypothetical protein F3I46_12860 [Pantoea sp. M_1]
MLHLIVRVVLNVAEAQRAGVEPVLIGGGRRADDRTVQLRVLTPMTMAYYALLSTPNLLYAKNCSLK